MISEVSSFNEQEAVSKNAKMATKFGVTVFDGKLFNLTNLTLTCKSIYAISPPGFLKLYVYFSGYCLTFVSYIIIYCHQHGALFSKVTYCVQLWKGIKPSSH